MGDIINKITSTYTYVIHDMADKRTSDLPFMSNPFLIFMIVSVYLKFCISFGPRIMKNRPAFELKNILMFYNIFQIFLSFYLMYEGLCYLLAKDRNLLCDPITDSADPEIRRTARSAWLYFFAKITELLETVFFVLRKKTKQISTLHLYHHTMVIFTGWLAAKYFPVGPIVLVGTLNSFVHVLMYIYYFLAGLGPQYHKYLWWKKHVTIIQLIQFFIVLGQNTMALFNDCNYPKSIHMFIIANTMMLIYMFSKFYYHTYIKVKPKTIEVSKEIKNIKNGQKIPLKNSRKVVRAGE